MIVLIFGMILVGVVFIWLYELRRWLGLSLLYFFVGSNQLAQVLLVSTVYVELGGRYPVYPGSAVLFSSGLFVVLLVYLKEDIPTTRKLIYGIVLVNVGLGVLMAATAGALSRGWLRSVNDVTASFWAFNAPAHIIGTVVVVADVFLLIVVYETLRSKVRWMPLAARVPVSLVTVLALDTLVYIGMGYSGQPGGARLLAGNLIGKALSGTVYGLILSGYLWFSERRVAGPEPRELRDPFTIFTYRGRIRQLQEEKGDLLRAKGRAESADRLKSAFLATMSHELRTPLNSIIGFTGTLLDGLAGPVNDEQRKQLGMVLSSARHLLALINDVLDLSKIEAGQLDLRSTGFDLRAVVSEVVESVEVAAAAKGIPVIATVAPELGEIVSDGQRVRQILLNLLSNAVKFTEAGEVRVEAEAAADRVLLRVSDTGIGMEAEEIDRLFRPFVQLDSGLSRRHEGTGLGLSISANLARLLGGGIAVESRPGVGSTFTVNLPRSTGEAR